MIAGLGVAVAGLSVYTYGGYQGGKCYQSFSNITLAITMYVSYLVLFLHFFYRAYAKPAHTKGAGAVVMNGTQNGNGKPNGNGTQNGNGMQNGNGVHIQNGTKKLH